VRNNYKRSDRAITGQITMSDDEESSSDDTNLSSVSSALRAWRLRRGEVRKKNLGGMVARGEGSLAGAQMFIIMAFASSVFMTLLPMWIITRTELGRKACWRGEGIFQIGYEWGDDIDEIDVECGSEEKRMFTSNAFCNNENSDASDPAYNQIMCNRVTYSKISALVSILSFSLALGVNSCGLGKKPRAIKMLRGTMALVVLGTGAAGMVLILMNGSPMFSQQHFQDLSKHELRQFDGIGCVFQTPLKAKSIERLIQSSPLTCLFAGPSTACAGAALACGFFGIVLQIHTYMVESAERPEKIISEDDLIMNLLDSPAAHQFERWSIYNEILKRNGRIAALGLPVLIFANLVITATFMCFPATSVSAIVNAKLVPESAPMDGEGLIVREDVFDFTLIESLSYFIRGKAWMLATLTFCFGLCWPFLKIALWLVLYFLPAPASLRHETLHLLNWFGKWSLVNGFVLCLMLVAFYFETVHRIQRWMAPLLIPKGMEFAADLEVTVDPGIGTYAYISNVLWSIIVGQIIFYVNVWLESLKETEKREESLFFEFCSWRETPLNAENDFETEILDPLAEELSKIPPPSKISIRRAGSGLFTYYARFVRPLVGIGVLLAFGATAVGAAWPVFKFDFGGVMGETIVPENQRSRSYSLVSAGGALDKSGSGASPTGAHFIMTVFFSSTIAVPLLRLVFGFLVWVIPLSLRAQENLFFIDDVLSAWSALDVIFVSLVATVFEITGLSKAVLSSAFPGLENAIEKLLPSAGGLFSVDQKFLPGIYMLFAAVLLEKIFMTIIIKELEAAIQRARRLRNDLAESSVLPWSEANHQVV